MAAAHSICILGSDTLIMAFLAILRASALTLGQGFKSLGFRGYLSIHCSLVLSFFLPVGPT